MEQWVVKRVPVKQLRLVEPPLRDETQHARLKELSYAAPTFLSSLIDTIAPVPVLAFKRHYYPVRHIPELKLISQLSPNTSLPIAVKGKANSVEEIQQHCASVQWFDLLHSHDCKDLFGLQTEWLHAFNYRPLLNQKQLCGLLKCERTTLYKRHERLLPRWQSCDESVPISPSSIDFDSLTAHIPDK